MTIEKNKKNNRGIIKKILKVANEMFLIEILADSSFESKAGQFISILCGNHTMRRPFSIMNFENNVISVLFKRKGDGTAYISSLKEGDTVDFIGSLGNGFSCEPVKTLCVGAGVGVAPVYYLKKELGNNAKLIAGFQNEKEIPQNLVDEIEFLTTDDGSGNGDGKGSIIDYLEEQVNEFKPEKICVCGPHIVLKLVSQIAKKHNIDCEVAMEKTMACSIGVCRGCVIRVVKNGEEQNASVCKDGPVFNGQEVVW